MKNLSGSQIFGRPSGSPAAIAWLCVSTKPCMATMPSSLQSTYSPGVTAGLPAVRARIFSAIVMPIDGSPSAYGLMTIKQLFAHQLRRLLSLSRCGHSTQCTQFELFSICLLARDLQVSACVGHGGPENPTISELYGDFRPAVRQFDNRAFRLR